MVECGGRSEIKGNFGLVSEKILGRRGMIIAEFGGGCGVRVLTGDDLDEELVGKRQEMSFPARQQQHR